MNLSITTSACALVLCAIASLAGAAEVSGGHWDGLVEVKPKRLDAAFLLPGADFRPYKKLMIDPVEVAFKKDWAKDYNRDAATLSQRLTQEDIDRISQAARDAFTEVFNEAYQKAGLEIVTTPGADVLRVRPGIMDLYVTAPDNMSSGRSRTYTDESGEAMLFVELRDSTSGTLLGRGLDRRATRNTGPRTDLEQRHQPVRLPRALQAVGGHERQGIQRFACNVAGSGRPPAGPETRQLNGDTTRCCSGMKSRIASGPRAHLDCC